MKDTYNVIVPRKVEESLKKLPLSIRLKLQAWIDDVGERGLMEVRKISGYHDEPLKGKLKGKRSIRLSIAYRAIYVLNEDGDISFVEVKEVNKHAYKK